MITAVLASRNAKKIEELRRILGRTLPGIKLLSLSDIGFEDEIEETGATFEENAMIKAKAGAVSGLVTLADDDAAEVHNGAVHEVKAVGEGIGAVLAGADEETVGVDRGGVHHEACADAARVVAFVDAGWLHLRED